MDRLGAEPGHDTDRLPRRQLDSLRRFPAQPDALSARPSQSQGRHRPAACGRDRRRLAHLRLLHRQGLPVGHAGARSATGQRRHVHAGRTARGRGRRGGRVGIDQNVSTITGFFVRNSVTLRIDNELITYTRRADASRHSASPVANAVRTARRRPLMRGREGPSSERVLRALRAGPGHDAVHGSCRRHGGHVQRVRLRHDLLRRVGRRGHFGRCTVGLALWLAVRVRGVAAAQEARPDGDEHVSPSSVVRAESHLGLGPSHAEPQTVHRPAQRGQREQPPHVPARRVGLVGTQELDRPAGGTHLCRRYRVPDDQGSGDEHGLRPDGHRPDTPPRPCRRCRDWPPSSNATKICGIPARSARPFGPVAQPGAEFTLVGRRRRRLAVRAGGLRQAPRGRRQRTDSHVASRRTSSPRSRCGCASRRSWRPDRTTRRRT